jgi:glycosyl transferase family 25
MRWIDRIFVINLERRTLRRQQMEFGLRQLGLLGEAEFIPAIDGDSVVTPAWLDEQGYGVYASWRRPDGDNPWERVDITRGLAACSLTHWRLWRRIVEEDLQAALILEDDVAFHENLVERLETSLATLERLRPTWDLFYLRRNPRAPDRGELTDTIVLPGFSWCTDGYVLHQRGARKVLTLDYHRCVIPVDEFLPALYAGHHREDVRRLYCGRVELEAYAARPPMTVLTPHQSDTDNSSAALS